jgi:N-methylhydantoinase A
MSQSMRPIIGVDVGGTFTDIACFEPSAGRFRTAKVPSNRGDEARGFIDGLQGLGSAAALGAIVHGTTVGTNALLERKGARVGLITTRGFRDALEMRRRDRPHTWGLWGDFRPVVPRPFRLEVPERTLADGRIREPVDLEEVRAAARKLLAAGAEALCIVFINAYANPANEIAAFEAAQAIWPNPHIGYSAEILSEIREFERTSTTALNAYLQPVVATYLAKLEAALARERFGGSFHVIQSNGGVMSTASARKFPVRTALSGPAAGVIAAGAIAAAAGARDVITADLGGTSFDVSLIADGAPSLAAQSTIDFGLVLRTPMVEITTIGAGGGSIAHVDAGGLLSIGPESAGSRPGPVCYGSGNTRPTLTDANVVLGRINAERPMGGALRRLDAGAARAAIVEHVGKPLALAAEAAAEAIVRVANARMAGAIRLVSVERGFDPARFTLVPFGGGGALHAGGLIRDVGLKAALVPRYPGITSALGCIIADVRTDRVETINSSLDGLDVATLDARMAAAGKQLGGAVEATGLPIERLEVRYELDMHYLGQTHTVAVPLNVELSASGTGVSTTLIQQAFEAAYSKSFSRLLPGIPVRIVNLRTAATGIRPPFDLAMLAPASGTADGARRGTRDVWFGGRWWKTAIWDRLSLPVGATIGGPAILEQDDATAVVDPGLVARVDSLGNLIMEHGR